VFCSIREVYRLVVVGGRLVGIGVRGATFSLERIVSELNRTSPAPLKTFLYVCFAKRSYKSVLKYSKELNFSNVTNMHSYQILNFFAIQSL
jgi:hypothetical protein